MHAPSFLPCPRETSESHSWFDDLWPFLAAAIIGAYLAAIAGTSSWLLHHL